MRYIRQLPRLMSASILVASGTLLQGCADNKFATYSAAGAAFPQAEYQIKGKTKYDQVWVDKTIEAEIAGFGFNRPKPRPAYLDAPAAKPKVVVKPPSAAKPASNTTTSSPILLPTPRTTAPTVTVAPPPKPTLTQRLRARVKALEDKLRSKEGN